jgi:hypothetical protein
MLRALPVMPMFPYSSYSNASHARRHCVVSLIRQRELQSSQAEKGRFAVKLEGEEDPILLTPEPTTPETTGGCYCIHFMPLLAVACILSAHDSVPNFRLPCGCRRCRRRRRCVLLVLLLLLFKIVTAIPTCDSNHRFAVRDEYR